ncbi:MAG: sulfatase [Acidobacteriota bacterium]
MTAPLARAVRAGFLSCLLGVVAVGCADDRASKTSHPRGVLLISLDTVRADRLGTYGYDRPTSPFLDELARRSAVFEHAFVQLPGTLPSHMSMLTGLYPAEHGVYPPAGRLPDAIPMLQEVFNRAGWTTGGFVEGGYMHEDFGFARGFDAWSSEAQLVYDDIERTLARGLSFVDDLEGDEPFFLFLHSYAVHDPYFPPEPYASDFDALPVEGAFAPTGPNFVAFNRGELEITPEALTWYSNAYDASIRYVDDQLRAFFAELEARGVLDETLVVVTSDHGEEFLEHGSMVHVQIYPETLHVPLIVSGPSVEARRIESVVESVDLAPTVLALAGLESAEIAFSGESLVPLMRGERETTPGTAYAESYLDSSRALIRRSGDSLFHYKEQRRLDDNKKSHPMPQEFDLEAPGGRLTFFARSFRRPRTLTFYDGEAAFFEAKPPVDQGVRIDVPLPADRQSEVIRVVADGCVSPQELGESEDARCLAVLLAAIDPPQRNAKLFDLEVDPTAQDNLASSHGEVVEAFSRRLGAYAERSDNAGENLTLDPEHIDRLKSLGYLN